ncbi:hypothetical protein H310_03295 [Aphanomyces invadans]|uniref:Uncharacterized protein n=1 Tax=Aphanomyces invadans TaxID=157072 RepID=A0A024UIW3_9STRA|nr:hypothetical protein H310_03295 [Aphanomyces invadans]ETW05543.1 hypothetical protein H310_03295 [Aphanomyces invadans]|eukprot:XP_008865320.1 hypothetical protein H310_03295 [Aphanomyces invadans]
MTSENVGPSVARPIEVSTSSARRVVDLMTEPSHHAASCPVQPVAPATKISYASTVRRAVARAHDGEVKATLTRPSRYMLAKLLQLANDDETSDAMMLEAIQEDLPYPKRVGTTTF